MRESSESLIDLPLKTIQPDFFYYSRHSKINFEKYFLAMKLKTHLYLKFFWGNFFMKIQEVVDIGYKIRCAKRESDISIFRPLFEQKTPRRLVYTLALPLLRSIFVIYIIYSIYMHIYIYIVQICIYMQIHMHIYGTYTLRIKISANCNFNAYFFNFELI